MRSFKTNALRTYTLCAFQPTDLFEWQCVCEI